MARNKTQPAIRISFDIDDTLVCGPAVPTETLVQTWSRRRHPEQPRRGCRALMHALAKRGCRIWVYTTSGRSSDYLQSWFRRMGITLDGVVNQARHQKVVGRGGPSKYPPAFLIGLHVDDSPGVAMEGEAHRFRVVVVSPDDERWTERVLEAVDEILSMQSIPEPAPA